MICGNSVLQLKKLNIRGVAASRIHSVAYTSDTVYSWGLNKGQFGMDSVSSNSTDIQSKLFSRENGQIDDVCANEELALVMTTKGHLFALFGYKCQKVIVPTHRFVNNFRADKVAATSDHCVVLSDTGTLHYIRLENNQLCIETLESTRKIAGSIIDFAPGIDNSLLILMSHRKVFYGNPSRSRHRSSRRLSSMIDSPADVRAHSYLKMNFIAVPGLKDVMSIHAGASGSFAAITNDVLLPVRLPSFKEFEWQMREYLHGSDNQFPVFSDRSGSDLVFEIGEKQVYAHKFVVLAYSPELEDLLVGTRDQISFNTLLDLTVLERNPKLRISVRGVSAGGFISYLEKQFLFNCTPYGSFEPGDQNVTLGSVLCRGLSFESCESFNGSPVIHKSYDVVIYVDSQAFHAHRLVLAAESAFFKALIGVETLWKHRHGKHVEVTLDDISASTLLVILQYCYMDIKNFQWNVKLDTVFDEIAAIEAVLSAADELVIDGLKLHCEVLLQCRLNVHNV
eukprot:Partr_v1_DN28780_c2_g1_i1_m62842 putative Inhibitor of Bruton agammaglobulinemia tyrosine kinase